VSDLLERVLGEVRERLEESRRAVEEYERLQRALEALDNEPAPAREAPAAKRPRAAVPRAQSVANRERLLAVIGDRPGVTREELRAATGLSGASVAQGLRRAVASGRVREEELPGGQVGFSLIPENAAVQPAESEPPEASEAAEPAAESESAETAVEPEPAEPTAEPEATAHPAGASEDRTERAAEDAGKPLGG
jgi:hypothetical protein